MCSSDLRVRVANGHQSLGFATNLDQDDKVWLVDQIVQMLGNASPAESTAEVPASFENSPLGVRQTAADPGTSQGSSIGAEFVSPGELPPESAIAILEEGSGLLLFSFAILPSRTTRFVLPALMLGFLVFWLWWVGLFAWRMWQPGALWPFRIIRS